MWRQVAYETETDTQDIEYKRRPVQGELDWRTSDLFGVSLREV